MTAENLNDEASLEENERFVSAMKGLLASDGWKVYCDVIEKQQVVRFDGIILNPLASMDQVLEQEYKKGEIAGLRMCLQLPQTLLSVAEEALRQQREQRDASAEAGNEGDQE